MANRFADDMLPPVPRIYDDALMAEYLVLLDDLNVRGGLVGEAARDRAAALRRAALPEPPVPAAVIPDVGPPIVDERRGRRRAAWARGTLGLAEVVEPLRDAGRVP
jgi:hypothetical protein